MDIYEPMGLPENAELLKDKANEHIEGLKVVLEATGLLDKKFDMPEPGKGWSAFTYNDAMNSLRGWIYDSLFGIKPLMTAEEIIGDSPIIYSKDRKTYIP
jgi:hypothetical protein